MVITTRRINYVLGDTIRIKPVFDFHYGCTSCDIKALKNYLASDDSPNTYFIGGGDTLDSIIVTDKRYRKSKDDSEREDIVDEQIEAVYEILSPYRDRILGMACGNHEDTITIRCGTNPIKRLCHKRMLDVPFLGYSGLYRLALTENNARGRTVVIRYHHGWGGGSRTEGGNITKYSRDLNYWDADIYLYGHDHDRDFKPMERLGLSGDQLIAKDRLLCICGTYQKSYTMSEDPTYSEKKGYPPRKIGGIVVTITPQSRWVKLGAEM